MSTFFGFLLILYFRLNHVPCFSVWLVIVKSFVETFVQSFIQFFLVGIAKCSNANFEQNDHDQQHWELNIEYKNERKFIELVSFVIVFFWKALTVRTMHELSLIAPQQPKKAMMKTMAPIAIKMAGADHSSSPEMNELINSIQISNELRQFDVCTLTQEIVIVIIGCEDDSTNRKYCDAG